MPPLAHASVPYIALYHMSRWTAAVFRGFKAQRTCTGQDVTDFSFGSDVEEEYVNDCSMFSFGDDDEEEPVTFEMLPHDSEFWLAPMRERTVTEYTSRRGKHTNRGSRVSHAEYAARAMVTAEGNMLGVPCVEGECPFGRKCGLNFTPATLISAAQRVYGSHCGRQADGTPFSDPANPEKRALRQRRVLMLSWVRRNAQDPSVIDECFVVEGQGPVCHSYAKAAYHFSDFSWNTYMASARAGTLQADADLSEVGGVSTISRLSEARENTAAVQTVHWWKMWLALEDQVCTLLVPVVSMRHFLAISSIDSTAACANVCTVSERAPHISSCGGMGYRACVGICA